MSVKHPIVAITGSSGAGTTSVQSISVVADRPPVAEATSVADAESVNILSGMITARDVRAYSRRQMTWFRRDAAIRWFDPTAADPLPKILEAAA